MASTQEMFQGWLNSGGQAKTPESAAQAATAPASNSTSTGDSSAPEDGYEDSIHASNSKVDEFLKDSEGNPEDSKEGSSDSEASPSEAKSEEKPAITAKETLVVTDETGKRRKIEVDFSNKEQLKKHVQMAYGARKWQAERDQAILSKKEVEAKLAEQRSNWDLMNDVYSKQGVAGLVDLLEGRRGAHADYEKRILDRARFMEKASPEEIEALNAREELDRMRREHELTRKSNEEFKKQISQEREQAELRSMESRINPVFEKYRFADKLGDPNDEHMFDEMLWNSTLKRLEPYEEKGLDITPELVEREFRSVAGAIRKRIGLQAEKKAAKAVEQKKQEATENVQVKVKSGYKTGGAASEAKQMLNSNNIGGILSNWGKYKGVFK